MLTKTPHKTNRIKENKELTEEEKAKLEEKKKIEENKLKADQARQEELRKRLDEPEPKSLNDAEKEAYLRRYQEIVELFTEINLRAINQKHEANIEQKEQDQIVDTQSKDNKDIKEIENSAQNQDDQAQEQPAANECPYFGSRILNEISMQYSFRYL